LPNLKTVSSFLCSRPKRVKPTASWSSPWRNRRPWEAFPGNPCSDACFAGLGNVRESTKRKIGIGGAPCRARFYLRAYLTLIARAYDRIGTIGAHRRAYPSLSAALRLLLEPARTRRSLARAARAGLVAHFQRGGRSRRHAARPHRWRTARASRPRSAGQVSARRRALRQSDHFRPAAR